MFDWDAFLLRLRKYPATFYRILPSYSGGRIMAVEGEFGRLPTTTKEMLRRFDGAKLFISGIPFVRLFRLSNTPPLPPLEWAPEWCIEEFTRKWRAAGSDRQDDWAIAMMNYGALVLLQADDTVKEWDTGESRWLLKGLAFGDWIEKVMREGELIMAD